MANLPYFNLSDLLKEAKSDITYMDPVITQVVPEPVQEAKPTTVKSNRCSHAECKRKLMLTDVTCKCDKRYCISHRHPESHSCAFDYKASGLAHLSTILVKANGDRLKERI
jgi:hypothetical protein